MQLVEGEDGLSRCSWGLGTPDYQRYHDEEWGIPTLEDSALFEKICLEGFQSGLSWLTILRKRENFRNAFLAFDMDLIAKFNDEDVERLAQDAGIVRHRGKIRSTINNAKKAQILREEFGSLKNYFWGFEPERRACPDPIPSTSDVSKALSKDLKKRGWSFVGPTTAYAFMQAMGLVNDHLPGCCARKPCEDARTSLANVLAK